MSTNAVSKTEEAFNNNKIKDLLEAHTAGKQRCDKIDLRVINNWRLLKDFRYVIVV